MQTPVATGETNDQKNTQSTDLLQAAVDASAVASITDATTSLAAPVDDATTVWIAPDDGSMAEEDYVTMVAKHFGGRVESFITRLIAQETTALAAKDELDYLRKRVTDLLAKSKLVDELMAREKENKSKDYKIKKLQEEAKKLNEMKEIVSKLRVVLGVDKQPVASADAAVQAEDHETTSATPAPDGDRKKRKKRTEDPSKKREHKRSKKDSASASHDKKDKERSKKPKSPDDDNKKGKKPYFKCTFGNCKFVTTALTIDAMFKHHGEAHTQFSFDPKRNIEKVWI